MVKTKFKKAVSLVLAAVMSLAILNALPAKRLKSGLMTIRLNMK